MSHPHERFFIPLRKSGASAIASRQRHTAEPEVAERAEDYPPYLQESHSLPDFLAFLASCRTQTQAEELCLARYLAKLTEQIKQARIAWENAQLDAPVCP